MSIREKDLRRLVIKSYHIDSVEYAEDNRVTTEGILTVRRNVEDFIIDKKAIASASVKIIAPGAWNIFTNSMMDIIPISTKVLGNIGEGITHTLTGAYVILTGVDVNGIQTAEFGSSEGILKEKLFPGRAGTPSENDWIISFDVIFQPGMGQDRQAVTEAHKMCDRFIQEFRNQMKKFRGDSCTERHEYHDVVRPGKKRVLIVKQVAGQGAMYDMHLFGKEPSGMENGKSIIDMGNMPVLVTPNEYRDGILRSMQ